MTRLIYYNFLPERKFENAISSWTSAEYTNNLGVPQRSVISQALFDLVMCKLDKELSTISKIRHTIYAEDVTTWTCRGQEVRTILRALRGASSPSRCFHTGQDLTPPPTKMSFGVVSSKKSQEDGIVSKFPPMFKNVPIQHAHSGLLGVTYQSGGKWNTCMQQMKTHRLRPLRIINRTSTKS